MASHDKSASSHRFSFYRAGGVDQVRLDRGADLLNLDQLDQKLWVALSCPVKGLEFDERTLALLDSDKDGRVRVPEILAAVKWLGKVVKNADDLVKGQDGVALASINAATPEGKSVLASAKHLLASLGKETATSITVAETMQTAELFAKAKLNGDGIVPPSSIGDADARAVAEAVVACTGGAPDRSGQKGFGQAHLDAFFADCAAFDAWQKQAEGDAKTLLPLGAATAAAAGAVATVKAKVDDFFARCRLAAFDARALAALNRQESAYLEIAAKDLSISAVEVAGFPLATIEPNKALPLSTAVNPAWADAVVKLRDDAVAPLLGKEKQALTEAEWRTLTAKLGPYQCWAAAKAGASVEALGLKRVREILAGGAKKVLAEAVAADAAVAPEIDAIANVEKLARYQRDLHKLLNNFVSFSDFYARRTAIFQVGTLYFDGRSCDLCISVNDAGKHGTLAPMSKTYLAYVDCTRPSGEKMQVAAAFTAGSDDNLFVGRNGLFYDRKGRDWDATIVKIVSNPISIGQAFWAPYKKLVRYVEESAAKRAAAADEAATAKLQTAASSAGDAAAKGAPASKPKFDIGTIAALGVAVGGITAALSGVLAALGEMEAWKLPLVLIGVTLAISGPSMLIAWLKLRQRNLGPMLDANGWAVNALTKINIPLGAALTDTAAIPPGSDRSLVDPYAPKKSPWPKVLLVLAFLALVGFGLYRTNYLHQWLPKWIPAHHLDTGLVPAATSGLPGAAIEIKVASGATALTWSLDGGAPQPLPVADGKATLTIPADAKAGSKIVVTDGTVLGNQFEVTVLAAAG
ncbi:MAG: hypothetical protein JNL90_15005 [Planctomycetes bacterium]|nr:hypothetical protein [Planctomycetota bacterium]